MSEDDWQNHDARSLAVFLDGSALHDVDHAGVPVTDTSFLVLFNAHGEPVTFTLPNVLAAGRWTTVIDTGNAAQEGVAIDAGAIVDAAGRSVVVLEADR